MAVNFNNEAVRTVCRRNDITQLCLFGSFARGEERDDSDVDLLVQFSSPKSLLSVVAAQRELSEALGRPVDLVTEPAISPYLRERILSNVQVVYHA
jgi:uncharacterized protein